MAEKLADALLMPKAVQVSTLEMDRPGPSYTADTVEQLHEREPEAELWLLVGSDMFLSLHTWGTSQDYPPSPSVRLPPDPGRTRPPVFAAQKERLERDYGARVALIPVPGLVEISSTRLRELLSRGEGREYLHPSVYGYILLHGLYGTHADLKMPGPARAAGLLLLHDPPQAGGPRDGGGGGGGQAGQILGR